MPTDDQDHRAAELRVQQKSWREIADELEGPGLAWARRSHRSRRRG
jgi:hypothetical protein